MTALRYFFFPINNILPFLVVYLLKRIYYKSYSGFLGNKKEKLGHQRRRHDSNELVTNGVYFYMKQHDGFLVFPLFARRQSQHYTEYRSKLITYIRSPGELWPSERGTNPNFTKKISCFGDSLHCNEYMRSRLKTVRYIVKESELSTFSVTLAA